MITQWRDDRRFHLVTRGNVDGIVSAALFYARYPDIKTSFVTSSSGAVDTLRRDIQSKEFFVVDLGVTDDLIHATQLKTKQGAKVHFLDHHQQTQDHQGWSHRTIDAMAQQGISAATLSYRFLGLDGLHEHLAALADITEYCQSHALRSAAEKHGYERLVEEARMLDYAWRLEVDDDRFRQTAARKLSEGKWPSEVPEIARRFLQVKNEGRWERALEKVRNRLIIRDGVGLLRFGRYRTSLHGFGSRALSRVAEDAGCRVAVLVNSRKNLSSLSVRGLGDSYALGKTPPLNLGRFVEDFTRVHGLTGGGHPSSAGAKIYTRDVPMFVQQIRTLA